MEIDEGEMELDGGLSGKFVFHTKDIIGSGRFGKVYKGRNMNTFEEVAIKIGHIGSMILPFEYLSYKLLNANKINRTIKGLPQIFYHGNIGLKCMAMAMELLGPSLNELFTRCGNKLSLKTVLMTAIQMLPIIKYIHSRKLIHRDLKPENILVGRPRQTSPFKESKEDTIYLIDFGTTKVYIDKTTNNHIPYNSKVGIFGTYQFMSANSHLSIEQSRRDDLESLGYVLLYLVKGTLPWTKYLETDHVDSKNCGEMKNKITTQTLCADLPEEFANYFNYVKKLEFFETPDYDKLIDLFQNVYNREKFPDDNLFDWSTAL